MLHALLVKPHQVFKNRASVEFLIQIFELQGLIKLMVNICGHLRYWRLMPYWLDNLCRFLIFNVFAQLGARTDNNSYLGTRVFI